MRYLHTFLLGSSVFYSVFILKPKIFCGQYRSKFIDSCTTRDEFDKTLFSIRRFDFIYLYRPKPALVTPFKNYRCHRVHQSVVVLCGVSPARGRKSRCVGNPSGRVTPTEKVAAWNTLNRIFFIDACVYDISVRLPLRSRDFKPRRSLVCANFALAEDGTRSLILNGVSNENNAVSNGSALNPRNPSRRRNGTTIWRAC